MHGTLNRIVNRFELTLAHFDFVNAIQIRQDVLVPMDDYELLNTLMKS